MDWFGFDFWVGLGWLLGWIVMAFGLYWVGFCVGLWVGFRVGFWVGLG